MPTWGVPSPEVIAAFAATGAPTPLGGGQGTAWRAGDVVLKPLDLLGENLEWQAEVLGSLRCDGFRVSPPRRSLDGRLVVDGWCAWQYVEGRHEERRWVDILAVGERFHAALAGVPRPAFLDARTDHWAIGDRVAWGGLPIEDFFHVKHLPRMASALRPLEAVSQLVHGDLTGNALFDDRLPPAVIDFSPYWRPLQFGTAIVVGDALLWEGADESLLGSVENIPQFGQYLLRALIYRAVADRLFRPGEPDRDDDEDFFLGPVELAVRLAGA
jgi:uncharacterized protein (TIGR02569 family)